MKRFSWILTIPFTVMVVIFAVANRSVVPIDLWPFEIEVPIPIFLLVLGSMLFGFLIGAMVMWLSMGKKQWRKSRAAKGEIAKLERHARELERARERAETRHSAPPPTATIAPRRDNNLTVA